MPTAMYFPSEQISIARPMADSEMVPSFYLGYSTPLRSTFVYKIAIYFLVSASQILNVPSSLDVAYLFSFENTESPQASLFYIVAGA